MGTELRRLVALIAFVGLPVEAATPCDSPSTCERACLANHGAACTTNGLLLVAKEPARAYSFFQRACDLDDAEGCAELSLCFELGRGTEVNLDRAFALANVACKKGSATTCARVARSWESRAAAAAMPAEAVSALSSAARAYDAACASGLVAKSCAEYARLALWGLGVSPDPGLAAERANRACEQQFNGGCALLAAQFELGLGVRANADRARELRKKAPKLAERLKLPPLPMGGLAQVKLQPVRPDFDVFVDSLFAGRGIAELSLPPSKHVIEVSSADGKKTLTRQVELSPKQQSVLALMLPGSLKLETKPPGAEVKVDGKTVGVTPWVDEREPGKVMVEVSLSGYVSQRFDLVVAEEKQTVERVTLLPLAGNVSITTRPSGAELLVDNKAVGTSPWSGSIQPGQHTLRARANGLLPAVQVVQIVAGREAAFELELAVPTFPLAIDTQPPGAQLSLDGQRVGVSPWKGKATAGTHQVTAQRDRYITQDRTLELSAIAASQKLKLVLEPVPLPSGIRISHQPKEVAAGVLADGEPVGSSPLMVPLAPGAHFIVVASDGYESAQLTVEIKKSVVEAREVVLKSMFLPVDVVSIPTGSALEIDGKPLGSTPFSASLTPGRHTLVVTREGFGPATRTLDVKQGMVRLVEVELQALPPPAAPVPVAPVPVAPVPVAPVPVAPVPVAPVPVAPPPVAAPVPVPVPAPAPVAAKPNRDALLRVLTDGSATHEAKQAALRDMFETTPKNERTGLVAMILPPREEELLCLEFGYQLEQVALSVDAEDRFGTHVEGDVTLNGKAYGKTPAELSVPQCATALSVRRTDPAEEWNKTITLTTTRGSRKEVATFGGRPPLGVVSLYMDMVDPTTDKASPVELYGYLTSSRTNGFSNDYRVGVGIQFEYFAKYFYFRFGFKESGYANDHFANGLFETLRFSAIPSGDVNLGAHGTVSFGNGTARLHLAGGLGVWSIFWASVRGRLALTLGDVFTIGGAVAFNLNPAMLTRAVAANDYFFSGEVTIGLAFPTR